MQKTYNLPNGDRQSLSTMIIQKLIIFFRIKVMNTSTEKKKQSLLTRIREKSPFPIWVFIIIFGPILPVFILLVYCIDWYYQVYNIF